jgi:hypothetical protein
MALAASGTLAKTVEAWERLAASSATLQTLFDVVTADAAKARIYWLQAIQEPDEELPDERPEQQPFINGRPFAIVDINQDRRERVGVAEWKGGGEVILVVEVAVPWVYCIDRAVDTNDTIRAKYADRQTWGLNQAGNIRDEIIANSGLADASLAPYLNVTDFSLESGPGAPEDDEAGDFVGFVFRGSWEG